MISVIIVFKKTSKFLVKSLENLKKQTKKNFEVLLVSEKNIKISNIKNLNLRLIKSKYISPGKKRHIGALMAKGDILAFIDDDAYAKTNWIHKIQINLEKFNAVTGPAIPPLNEKNKVKKNLFSSIYFSNYFGGAFYRYLITNKIILVDDFASVNFAIKKNIYFKSCGFDNYFWPGEDSLLANDLVYKKNIKIYHVPEIIVEHERRDSLKKFIIQIFNYAKTRGIFFKMKIENSYKIKYILPSIIVLLFFTGLILKIKSILIIFIIYSIIIFFGSLDLIIKMKKLYMIFSTPFIIFFHFVYGVGFLFGINYKKYIKLKN